MPDIMKTGLVTTVSICDTVFICEKTVTPPAVDVGEPIKISCMRSGDNHLKWPKSRIDWLDWTFTGSWDPAVYGSQPVLGQVVNEYSVGANQLITITFPTGTTLTFWGFIRTFTPGELNEDENQQPTCTVTVCVTNTDNTGAADPPLLVVA